MTRGLRPFHSNVHGEVETRRAFQQLEAIARGGGGGAGGRWNVVWPPIAAGQVYDALFGDLVLCSVIGIGNTLIRLPAITPDTDGLEVCIKTGVNPDRVGGNEDSPVIFQSAAGQFIEPFEDGSGGSAREMHLFGPHLGAANTFIFAASFVAKGWFAVAHWSWSPEA